MTADCRSTNELQDATQKRACKTHRRALLFSGAAADDVGELLHEAWLIGLLSPRLNIGTRCGRSAVRCQVWLAVLELSLRRGSFRWRQLSHALPLDLRIAVVDVSWASSGLDPCGSGLWERLV